MLERALSDALVEVAEEVLRSEHACTCDSVYVCACMRACGMCA